ncbi:MAG: hypothetical protein N4A33_00370 [Bacteriovoracaceae bacterium]|jgi:HD-GYP domain-containing protein (c-di-GMP phosphodiesterase class II)|nr:hypothetical protein [Bacteriovoracaceae bacterium]
MIKEDNLTSTQKHKLALDLKPVFIAQLSIIDSLTHDAYCFVDGHLGLVLEEDELITNDFIKDYASTIGKEIFLHKKDFQLLNESLSEQLTKMTRSLSIGDQVKNSIKQANLLSFQMNNLYNDPFDNEVLTNQFLSSKNLATLLSGSAEVSKSLFKNMKKQNHHYMIGQPMLSSILLLSFLKEAKLFTEQENQNLFLASYFKDIGMCFVGRDKWDESDLTKFDKNNISSHSENSMKILNGRIDLSKKYLNIIKHHDFLNKKAFAKINKIQYESDPEITGIETTIVAVCDIFVAMTSKRPYRDEYSFFKALEFIKLLMADEYPQEYKVFVKFITKFFKSM